MQVILTNLDDCTKRERNLVLELAKQIFDSIDEAAADGGFLETDGFTAEPEHLEH